MYIYIYTHAYVYSILYTLFPGQDVLGLKAEHAQRSSMEQAPCLIWVPGSLPSPRASHRGAARAPWRPVRFMLMAAAAMDSGATPGCHWESLPPKIQHPRGYGPLNMCFHALHHGWGCSCHTGGRDWSICMINCMSYVPLMMHSMGY